MMVEILEASRNLFDQFNAENIVYCHWKSNEHLYEGLVGDTDLDILVHGDNKETARQILLGCGYISTVSQYGSRYLDVEDWITCDRESGKMLHVHLHYRMATGHKGMKEYSLPWGDEALQKRELDANFNVFVCPPEFELVSLFTRIGLKATTGKRIKALAGKYTFGKYDLREAEYLKERADFNIVENILKQYYEEDATRFLEIVKKDDLKSSDMVTLIKLSRKRMRKYRLYKGMKASLMKAWFSAVLPVRKICRHRFGIPFLTRKTLGKNKGVIIAFMGQDGAGKTTVTDEVKKWLSWKLDVKKVYLGNGENYKSWRKGLSSALRRFSNAPFRALRGVLVVADLKKLAKHTYKVILSARKYANAGGIVIFDRYPQVKYLGINDGPKIRANYLSQIKIPIIRRYVEMCAKTEEDYLKKASEMVPDSVVKLILDPEISIRRKPQEDLELVKRKHEIIKDLRFPQSDVLVVDANQDYNEEIKTIHKHLWSIIVSNQGSSPNNA